MPEHVVIVPARVRMGFVFRDYLCDNCETPVNATGVSFPTKPPIFEHKCPKCERRVSLRGIYPMKDPSPWQ